jgi:hypothetical protein
MEHRNHTIARYTIGCAFIFLTGTALVAQTPCEDLAIVSITYSAFDTTAIEVLVNNGSSEIFSYPSFVLLDAQGNTLAEEVVGFFGIGMGQQAHYPAVVPGATIPPAPFDGTLLLYGMFGDTLYCAFELTEISLCPPEECIPAEIYLINTGPLANFTVNWDITDPTGQELVTSGSFGMDDVVATHFDSVCLPPGAYTIWLSPFSPIDENYVLGITNNYAFSIGTNVAQQQDSTPLDLSFGWYEACTDLSQSIADHSVRNIQVILQGGTIQLVAPDHLPLGEVALWSADGRLLATRNTGSTMLSLSVEGLAAGVVLVRVVDPQGRSFVQRIFIP